MEISSTDFSLYQAFNNIDPFENFRFDAATAVIAQTLAQVHGVKRTKTSDFMIKWNVEPETKGQKQKNIMAKMMAFFGRFKKAEDNK